MRHATGVIVRVRRVVQGAGTECAITGLPCEHCIRRQLRGFRVRGRQTLDSHERGGVHSRGCREIVRDMRNTLEDYAERTPSITGGLGSGVRAIGTVRQEFRGRSRGVARVPRRRRTVFIGLKSRGSRVPTKGAIVRCRLSGLIAPSNGEVLTRKVRLGVGNSRGVYVVKTGKTKGAALLGGVTRRLLGQGSVGTRCVPRACRSLLSLSIAPISCLSGAKSGRRHAEVEACLNSLGCAPSRVRRPVQRLSNKRGTGILLLEVDLDNTGILVLSRPAEGFSPLSNPMVEGVLQRFPKTIVDVSRSEGCVRRIYSGVCRLGPGKLRLVNS